MAERARFYVFLACLGLFVGSSLEGLLGPTTPVAEVGQDLVFSSTSPNGKLIAGISPSWRLRVWNLEGRLVMGPVELPDPPTRVNMLAWRGDSRSLAVGASDRVWVVEPSRQKITVLKARWLVREVQFRGNFLMARADGSVFLWDAKSLALSQLLEQPYLLHADLSRDGSTLALGCFEEGIRIVDRKRKRVRRHLMKGLTPAGLRFCNDDRWLTCIFRFREERQRDQARLFDVRSGRQLGPTIQHPELRGFAISRDGHRLLLRSEPMAEVWDPSSGTRLSQFHSTCAPIDSLSPDGKLVATSPVGKAEVIVWSADSGKVLKKIEHPQPPSQVRYPSNRLLEITRGVCRLWRLD